MSEPDDRPPAHLKVEGGADRDVYCNGERLDKSDAGLQHVELQRELDTGYTAEFTVGYDGTIGVGVELYEFPAPDPVAETELECTDGEPRPTFEGELRGEEFLVEIVKRDEPELVTDGGQSESEVEHTLFIVERDDLDDAVPYQVLKAEHPPDSEQTKALEGVMCQLVEQAEAETGERHRLVREVDAPDVVQSHYETHEERIEGETLVTDGGRVEDEAAVERDRKALSDLTQEEKDTLVSELMREPQTSVAVVSAVRKIDDIEAGAGELPKSFQIGCQKCGEVIEEGDEYTTAFGYYYCKPCNERAREALKTAEDVDGGEA